MLIDSILIFMVMRRLWKWPMWLAVAIATPLTLIDLLFLASNSLKIDDGGWFPLVIGAVVFTLLTDVEARTRAPHGQALHRCAAARRLHPEHRGVAARRASRERRCS
jgi:K+ transporter